MLLSKIVNHPAAEVKILSYLAFELKSMNRCTNWAPAECPNKWYLSTFVLVLVINTSKIGSIIENAHSLTSLSDCEVGLSPSIYTFPKLKPSPPGKLILLNSGTIIINPYWSALLPSCFSLTLHLYHLREYWILLEYLN